MADKYEIQTCGRCDGTGTYKWHTSQGTEEGICYGCQGTGKRKFNLSAAKREETAALNRIRRAEKNLEQFRSQHPDLEILVGDFQTLSALHNSFLEDLRRKIERSGNLSEKQIEAARTNIQRHAERKQAKEVAHAQAVEQSKHLGKIGERIETALIYKRSIEIVLDSGLEKYGYVFETVTGDIVIWWTTTYLTLPTNANITAKFTIKKHETYNNIKQTQVQRLQIKE